MKQVFIVMEGNGESYEDYMAYSIAAFSNKDDADNHATQMQKDYDALQELGNNNQQDFQDEFDSILSKCPYEWRDEEYYKDILPGLNEYLDTKYPGVISLDYSKHSFFVSEPVPFIK